MDPKSLPPLGAVRAFEAVARLGSFTKAAAELGMTQAAVSYQIKVLEERAGAPLFLRQARGLALTEAGQALAPAASDAFERLAAAWDASRHGARQTLRLSATLTFASNWLSRRLGTFQMAHPEIAVSLDATQVQRDFRRDGVDAAVRVGDGQWAGLRAHCLFGSDFTPMLNARLAARATLNEPADLLRLPIVHPDDPWWRLWFAAVGVAFEPAQVQSAGGHLGAQIYDANAAIGGQGAAILTRAFYAEEIRDGRLVQPFPQLCGHGGAYWLVYSDTRRNNPAVRAFRDWLLREAGVEDTAAE